MAAASTIFAAAHGAESGLSGVINPGSIVSSLALLCALYFGWTVLPEGTKRTADRYAESAWMAFSGLALEKR